MRLTSRDGLATAFVASAVLLYAFWTTGTLATGMSVRAIGVIAFALGWLACTSDSSRMAASYRTGEKRSVPILYSAIATVVGIVALVTGVIAIVGADEAMLATMISAMVLLWLMATVRHVLTPLALDVPTTGSVAAHGPA